MTTQIRIYMDKIWAGTGDLTDDGIIENCSTQFCDDNDQSLRLYDDIEDAIESGETELDIEVDGTQRRLTWAVSDGTLTAGIAELSENHPVGCSCGSPECPEWQAAQ